jgi:cytochrome P450
MCLLGTGLVTSEGKTWRDSRTSVSKVLRVDILEEIPGMAKRAVERLAEKLEQCKRANTTMEIAEEFRHLTLQVRPSTAASCVQFFVALLSKH